MFMYAEGRMQWTTGDSSGGYGGLYGTEALAGINAGDGINYVTVSGSRTPDIINITRTSNVGIPGVWMFQVGRCTYMCNIDMYNLAISILIITSFPTLQSTYVTNVFQYVEVFISYMC